MTAVLVVSHGKIAGEMISSLGKLLGPEAARPFVPVDVDFTEQRPALRDRLTTLAQDHDSGNGVIVVCDLWGSTPSNCALDAIHTHPGSLLIAGASLPMLIKLATSLASGASAATAARAAVDTAVKSLRVVDDCCGEVKT